VFPCVPGTKRPLTRHGFTERALIRSDRAVVAALARANIGVPTGRPDGFDVLDVDVHRSGSGFPALRRARQARLVDGGPRWSVARRAACICTSRRGGSRPGVVGAAARACGLPRRGRVRDRPALAVLAGDGGGAATRCSRLAMTPIRSMPGAAPAALLLLRSARVCDLEWIGLDGLGSGWRRGLSSSRRATATVHCSGRRAVRLRLALRRMRPAMCWELRLPVRVWRAEIEATLTSAFRTLGRPPAQTAEVSYRLAP